MDTQAQKLTLIQWVAALDDPRTIQQLITLKRQSQSEKPLPKRVLGDGKDVQEHVSDDFNDPIDAFKDYMP